MPNTTSPFFSIVVPTRNRSEKFSRALNSIMEQSFHDFEVIVVDDGSDAENAGEVQRICQHLSDKIRLFYRDITESQHGPNISRNVGIENAQGMYIGFLDDDDYWCDTEHLNRAQQALIATDYADFYCANQIAKQEFNDVESIITPLWLPYADRIVSNRSLIRGTGAYSMLREDLLQPEGIGFAHVNISLIKRELIDRKMEFWPKLPYEGDLNFFLRLIDKAETFIYCPETVSVNTVREQKNTSGVSSIQQESKQLFRILACQHAELHCTKPEVRQYINLLHAGVLKTLSKQFYRQGQLSDAKIFAARAAVIDSSFRWWGISLFLALQFLLKKVINQLTT